MSAEEMTVSFIVSDNSGLSSDQKVDVPIHIIKSSKYINSLILDCGIDDITIKVPQQYNSVFDIYLNVLNSNYTPVNDVSKLLDCFSAADLRFNMETFFADDMFFNYLMTQSYMIWNEFYSHINSLLDTRMVYLHTPYEFVPQKYMNTSSFFKDWIQINQNNIITINYNKVYYTNTTYYGNSTYIKTMEVCHTVDRQITGYKLEQKWYESGQLSYHYSYFDIW